NSRLAQRDRATPQARRDQHARSNRERRRGHPERLIERPGFERDERGHENRDDEDERQDRRQEPQRQQRVRTHRRGQRGDPLADRTHGRGHAERQRNVQREKPGERERDAVQKVRHDDCPWRCRARRFSRIKRSSSVSSSRSRSETASTSDESTGSGSPSRWSRLRTSSDATAPSISVREAAAAYTNARPTFRRLRRPFFYSRSNVVISVVYATLASPSSHASRTLISRRAQTSSMTLRSSTPRLFSRIS